MQNENIYTDMALVNECKLVLSIRRIRISDYGLLGLFLLYI